MAESHNKAGTQERGKGRMVAWMRAAEKWGGHWKRADKLIKCLNNFEQEGLVGLTNMRAGPPNHLAADVRSMWKARVVETIRECTATYWVPYMEEGIDRDWKKLKEFLLSNIQQCREDTTRSRGWEGSEAITKGIERVFKDRGEERNNRQEIPLPPAEVAPNKLGMIIRNMEGEGVMKRGEKRGPVNSRYDIDVAVGWKEDKAEIIGRALYGCRGRNSFIYRSLVKYLDIYEKEKKFISRHIRMRQGRFRKINSLKQYREVLCRKNCLLGKNELEMITRLYQVQIRTFREARNNDSNMICIEEIGQEYDRVVNILSKQGRWALIYSRGQERMCGRDRGIELEEDIIEEEKEAEGKRKEERERRVERPEDKEIKIVEGYDNRKKKRREEADREDNTDRYEKEQKEKIERRRGIQQTREENSGAGQDNPRIGMGNRKEQKKKEIEGGGIERKESIDKQADNKEAREQEEVSQVESTDRGREEKIGGRKDIQSIEHGEVVNRDEEEKNSIAEDVEDSPIELLDRGKLDRCLAEYVEDIRRKDREEKGKISRNADIQREKEGEEHRENNRQEETYRANIIDTEYKEKGNIGSKGMQQRRGEENRVEKDNLRTQIEDRRENNKKEIEGGSMQWHDRIVKQVEREEARTKEEEEAYKVDRIRMDRREEEIPVRKDIGSSGYGKVVNKGKKSSISEEVGDSPIELLDRGKLEKCLAEYIESTNRKDEREQEGNGETDKQQEEREKNLARNGRMQQRYAEEHRGVEHDTLNLEIEEKKKGEKKGVVSVEVAGQGSKGKEGSEEDTVEEKQIVRKEKSKEKTTQEEKETIDRERGEKSEDSTYRESGVHERGEGAKGNVVGGLDSDKPDTYLAEYVGRMHMIDREEEIAEEEKEDIQEGKVHNNIKGKRDKAGQKKRWKEGDSDIASNCSSIELLDIRELDSWLANNIKKLRIERGEEMGEIGNKSVEGEEGGGERNQEGGEGRARNKERIGDSQEGRKIGKGRNSRQHREGEKGKKRQEKEVDINRGGAKDKGVSKEEVRNRKKNKGRKEEGDNSIRYREDEEIERNSVFNDNYINRCSNIEREERRNNNRRMANENTSDSSEIEWIDRHRGREDREGGREGRSGKRGGRGRKGEGRNNGNTRDRRKKKEREVEKKQSPGGKKYMNILGMKEGEEEARERDRSSSEITTSSIAALFKDKHLEREGKRVGRKQITRRKVWERWKGIVRGGIRREIKEKAKRQWKVEKEEQDRQLVFDYTTQGLTAEEIKLLGRGEGFCVIDHKIDEDKAKVDIYHFQRRMRLHEMFREGIREEGQGELEIGTQGTVARRRERASRQSRVSIIETIQTQGTTVGSRENRESIGVGRGRRQTILGRVSSTPTRSEIRQRNEGRVSRARPGGREDRVEINTPRMTRGVSIRNERLSTVGRGIGERRQGDNREDIAQTGRGGRQRLDGTQRTQWGENRENRTNTEREVRRESTGVDRRSTIGLRGRGRRGSITSERERDVELEQREKGRRLPSMYDPESKNRSLNRYNICIQEEILLGMEDKKIKFKDNISKEERIALRALKKRIEEKEIIITRADKGSGLVAIDYEMYIRKGTKYIEEEVGAYVKVQESQQCIINRITKERNKIAEQLKEKGVIMVQTATYIKKQLEEKITGIKFYYKIHKDKNIDTMPLRPLQSCIKAPIQHLSIVLTDILQPLLTDKNISTFIFDSNQLLYRLEKLGNIPENCTLVSSDVSALYPSIPHREGFQAMKLFLEEKTEYKEEQIREIIVALKLVITENYMTWNKQIYKQISGVAMGTPVAVAYANIFMNWVDGEVKRGAPYIYEHIRFIDDNLFIVPKDRVIDMIEVANNILVPHIKFTYEKLEDQVGKGLPFLDTQLFITEEKKIESRLYTKSTDRHAYLLPSSFHPAHITQNIPMAVFGRIKKLCSRDEWFREDAKKAERWLLNRGYKQIEIQRAIDKTSKRDRWSMIRQIEKNRDSKGQKKEGEVIDIPLIITYNQHGKKIKKILKDRQPLLDGAFSKTRVRPRLSYRRKRNLNDLIVQKGLRGPIEDKRKELNIFSKCGERPGYRSRCPCKGRHNQEQCRCCMHSKEGIEGVDSKIYKPANCNSKNIIYVIGCSTCGKKYVGETQQRLKDRVAQHMYNVDKQNQPLYLHFRHVHKLEYLYITVVETVRGEEPFMRKVREAWWINHLRTLEPNGFNIKLECNQAYEEVRNQSQINNIGT